METKSCIVVGAGPAGLTAAIEFSLFGFNVTLFEKQDQLKGKVGLFCCKADDECQRCGVCHVDHRADEVMDDPRITVKLEHTVVKITDDGTRFTVTAKDALSGTHSVTAEYLVWAGGFDVFDAGTKEAFGYGRCKNVVTGLELEKMLREEDQITQPASGQPVKSMAFIQCVGSRDRQIGAAYCSQACCAFAFRLANTVKYENTDIETTIFYMDIQSPSRHFQDFAGDIESRIKMVKGLPGEVLADNEDRLVLKYEDSSDNTLTESTFDLVVLSVGFQPAPPPPEIRDALGLDLNQHGFVMPPVHSDRIAVVGTAVGPMDIPQSIFHARGVAGAMAQKATKVTV